MPVAAKRYADELLKEINADREAHGKAPFDDDKNGYIYCFFSSSNVYLQKIYFHSLLFLTQAQSYSNITFIIVLKNII